MYKINKENLSALFSLIADANELYVPCNINGTVNFAAWDEDVTVDLDTLKTVKYYECDLFLCAGTIQEASGDARLRRSLIADGQYHVLEIDLSTQSFWKGDIHKIRFDYFDYSSEGDVMFIKGITLE